MKQIVFYHSVACPRCHFSKMILNRVMQEFPNIQIQSLEFLTHRAEAKAAGVGMIPALVAGDKKLSGIVFTTSRVRKFLHELTSES